MFCSFCGKQNGSHALFCEFCGRALPKSSVSSEIPFGPKVHLSPKKVSSPKISSTVKKAVVTGILIAALIIVVLLLYYPAVFPWNWH